MFGYLVETVGVVLNNRLLCMIIVRKSLHCESMFTVLSAQYLNVHAFISAMCVVNSLILLNLMGNLWQIYERAC